jgi:hypothetical protein
MVSLAGRQIDYCVNQTFTASMSAVDIELVLTTTIKVASVYRFKIVSIIADGAQCNRQFQKRNFKAGGKDKNNLDYKCYMVHPVTFNPIFFISDPSHMIKKCVSSLDSKNRKIFMSVDGIDYPLSLVIQRDLWLSFNDNAGLNRFREFVMVDFEKNNFQKMRVGPCIKVLGEAMIDMIDQALIRLRFYHEFKNNPENNDKINPHEFYKDAKQYLGWRTMSLWFTRLFKILNSKKERINTEEYNHNLVFLKEFYHWFKGWKIEAVDRRRKLLPTVNTQYDAMTGFFTAEASEDCLSMIQGLIQLTEFYCEKQLSIGSQVYFVLHRFSQDLLENYFAKVRLGSKHGRLDHITTSASCSKASVVKELKLSERSIKKRNIENCDKENDNKQVPNNESFTEFAIIKREEAIKRKSMAMKEKILFKWEVINGKKHMVFR